MGPTPQSNSFLLALKGSDQDHTAVEAGLQVCVKARFVGKGQVFFLFVCFSCAYKDGLSQQCYFVGRRNPNLVLI